MNQGHDAAFWADEEASLLAPSKPHVVRDSKTPSGDFPISALRGPIISDALVRTFRSHGLDVRFVYTIDDYDPMDSQSMREQAGMAQYMGKPFFAIPSPDPAVAADFADYHATRFKSLFARLGVTPEFHRMRDLYRSGELDRQIDLVLRNAEKIREIHKRVANVEHPAGWLPISVICENCGRIGTTLATDYDGATVAYVCAPAYVEWAEGCGHHGRISPFKGNAKLLWNEQWCAQWDYFGVTYEEGGKDLLTAGGSRDRSNEIYREVFGKDPPLGLAHEFFLLGGKKMASSKGIGAKAFDLANIYPPEVTRFLMLRTHPKRHIEFDPSGMTLPRLMDEYDRCADEYLNTPEADLSKVWRLSQVSPDPAPPPPYRARFGTVANWLQIPSITPEKEAEREKAAPLDDAELRDLHVRIELAREWLERWAPDEAKFAVTDALPDAAKGLSEPQRSYLRRLSEDIDGKEPKAMQDEMYDVAKELGLIRGDGKVAQDAFAAIYIALIGKTSGPRAAWLIASLPRDFVRTRFAEAARSR